MKTIVIYHSADFDGLFCREIARKFLPQDTQFIGWDFGNEPVKLPKSNEESFQLYIMDLPVDRVLGLEKATGYAVFEVAPNIVWIDHHKSAIESHATDIPGYRIDGVSACRLAWQWFMGASFEGQKAIRPTKEAFVERVVNEPIAVRLAGEYDIWDKHWIEVDPQVNLFQHALRSEELHSTAWDDMLDIDGGGTSVRLLNQARSIQYAKTQENSGIIKSFGFDIEFEGLKFLACNHARFNSHLFIDGLRPEHDGCFGFVWNGKEWKVSLYHATGKEHIDMSLLAVKYGGGGHKGASGFLVKSLPFLT